MNMSPIKNNLGTRSTGTAAYPRQYLIQEKLIQKKNRELTGIPGLISQGTPHE